MLLKSAVKGTYSVNIVGPDSKKESKNLFLRKIKRTTIFKVGVDWILVCLK